MSTVEVGDDQVEHKSLFRPALGWPFSAVGAPDFHLLGKRVKDTVTLPDPAVILEAHEEHEEQAGVSNVFDRSDECPSENLYRHWIATEFSAAVQSGSPPPRQKQGNSERDNYYVNTGYAIRTLREELPNMFYKKLNFDIYRYGQIFHNCAQCLTRMILERVILYASVASRLRNYSLFRTWVSRNLCF